MKELICITCPRGCHLEIDDNMNVTGNFCPRGAQYAIKELTAPERTLTTSVRLVNRANALVSVKTDRPIPKKLLFEAMREIRKITLEAPVRIGQIVLPDLLSTGANVIITKNID